MACFRIGHLNANDDVGSHLFHHVDREVVDQAAVNKRTTVYFHRCEYTRDGHAGAHGGGHATVADDDFFTCPHVGGHAGEWDGQIIEIHVFLIANTEVVEQVDQSRVVDIGAGHEAYRGAAFILEQKAVQTEGDVGHHGAVTLTAFFRHGGAVHAVTYIL